MCIYINTEYSQEHYFNILGFYSSNFLDIFVQENSWSDSTSQIFRWTALSELLNYFSENNLSFNGCLDCWKVHLWPYCVLKWWTTLTGMSSLNCPSSKFFYADIYIYFANPKLYLFSKLAIPWLVFPWSRT